MVMLGYVEGKEEGMRRRRTVMWYSGWVVARVWRMEPPM